MVIEILFFEVYRDMVIVFLVEISFDGVRNARARKESQPLQEIRTGLDCSMLFTHWLGL